MVFEEIREKRILYTPGRMASVDVEDVGEAVFTLALDGVIVGQERVQSRTDHTFSESNVWP